MQQEEDDYFRSEEFLDILSRYQQAVSAGHTPYMDCDELMDVAEFFLSKGKYPEAQSATELAMDLHPDATDPAAMMADIMFEMHNWTEAADWLNRVLDNNPFDIQAWQNLADAQLHSDRISDALESAQYTLAIKPDDNIALLQKAYATSRMERYEEATELYDEYLRRNPDDDIALYQAAFNLCLLERYAEANTLLARAEEASQGLSPEQLNICLQRSYTEARLGHLQEALDALERSKEYALREKDVDYNLLTGHLYLLSHRRDKALEYFSLAMSDTDDLLGTLRSIAQIFMDCRDYDHAIRTFRQMEEIARLPDYSDSKAEIIRAISPSLAYCYYQTGDKDEFISRLNLAAFLNPRDTETLFQDIFPIGVSPEEYPYYADRLDRFSDNPAD